MKIQHLAVIFVLIVLPISLVLSLYTGNLVKVTRVEASYDQLLFNSTYDAIRAYQMNTLDNTYAAENVSRLRDVNASVNSFFNSMATGLSRSGYDANELREYIPAILFTLYDGFYTYGPYENVALSTAGKLNNKRIHETTNSYLADNNSYFIKDSNIDNSEYGLKSYIYYTCEYKGKTRDNKPYDIVINYTLDNYIKVYGTIDNEYYAYQGYYISTNNSAGNPYPTFNGTITRGGKTVQITPEVLGEYIGFYDRYNYFDFSPSASLERDNVIYQRQGSEKIQYFNYMIFNGVKYYFDDEHSALFDVNFNQNYAVLSAGRRTVNIPGGDYPYELNRYGYVNKYNNDGNITNSTNVSFNNTYNGIPIFRLDSGKLRQYVTPGEMESILNYVYNYTHDGNLIAYTPGADNARNNAKYFAERKKTLFFDYNAYAYYDNAYKFTNTVNEKIFDRIVLHLNPTSPNYSVVSDAYNTEYSQFFEGEGSFNTDTRRYLVHEKTNFSGIDDATTGVRVFDSNATAYDKLYDPDIDISLFNQHRLDVIISCIESAMMNEVKNFNDYRNASYEYRFPTISETDWDKIGSNICCLTMMQGIPLGNYKFYNNYSLVIDNRVNEFTPKSSIYIEDNHQKMILGDSNENSIISSNPSNNISKLKNTGDGTLYKDGEYSIPGFDGKGEYHHPGCVEYHQEVSDGSKYAIGYRAIDYDIDAYTPAKGIPGFINKWRTGEQPDNPIYDPAHDILVPNAETYGVQTYFYLRPGKACYGCLVSPNKVEFTVDDLLSGVEKVTIEYGEEPPKDYNVSEEVRRAYISALARERGAKARFIRSTTGSMTFDEY